MLKSVFSLELSSGTRSEAGIVGGLAAELAEVMELVVEGTGDARYSVEPDEADAISRTMGAGEGSRQTSIENGWCQ